MHLKGPRIFLICNLHTLHAMHIAKVNSCKLMHRKEMWSLNTLPGSLHIDLNIFKIKHVCKSCMLTFYTKAFCRYIYFHFKGTCINKIYNVYYYHLIFCKGMVLREFYCRSLVETGRVFLEKMFCAQVGWNLHSGSGEKISSVIRVHSK